MYLLVLHLIKVVFQTFGTLSLLYATSAENKNIQQGVTEIPDSVIQYKPNIQNLDIELNSVFLQNNKIYLRSFSDIPSFIRWATPNTYDDWSFSFTIERPTFSSVEFGGIYMYYSVEKLDIGDLNGGMSKFTGFKVGLECIGSSFDLAYGINYDMNFDHLSDYVMKHDSINPVRFEGYKEFTVKVVATDKNFKVELYGDKDLIYDSYRVNLQDKSIKGPGRNIGLLANYSNVASSKSFVLKDAQLYKRIEDSSYDALKYNQPPLPKLEYRTRFEIAHHDPEVKELIDKMHNIELILKQSLGDLPRTSLQSLSDEMKESYKEISKKLDSLTVSVPKSSKENKQSKQTTNLAAEMTKLEYGLKELTKLSSDLQFNLEFDEYSKLEEKIRFKYILVGAGVASFIFFIINELRDYRASK